MGIFDKIKGMVGSEDLDYNEYDGDLFGDEASIKGGPGSIRGDYRGSEGEARYHNGYRPHS